MAYSQALRCYLHSTQFAFTDTVETCADKHPIRMTQARALPSAGPLHDLLIAFEECGRVRNVLAARPIIEAAMRKAPFDAEVLSYCGMFFIYLGEPRLALDCIARSSKFGRNAPFATAATLVRAASQVQEGNPASAVTATKDVAGVIPNFPSPYLILTSAYGHLGRAEDAAPAAEVQVDVECSGGICGARRPKVIEPTSEDDDVDGEAQPCDEALRRGNQLVLIWKARSRAGHAQRRQTPGRPVDHSQWGS